MIEEIIIFKESIYRAKFSSDIEKVNQEINEVIATDIEGIKVSNEGGYHSNILKKGFEDLKQTVLINCPKQGYKIHSFWLNINKGNHFNKSHIHGSEGMAAVYYHQVCCAYSPICFSHLVPTLKPLNRFSYSPQNQDILYFDYTLPHETIPCNNVEHTRISIAFNLIPK